MKIVFDTQDERVKPGMSLSASIITGVKLDALMVPSSAIKTSSGSHYVESFDDPVLASATGAGGSLSVSTAVQPGRIPVVVGTANDTMTEIMSGLKEGDTVVSSTVKASSSVSSTQQRNNVFQQIPGVSGGQMRMQMR